MKISLFTIACLQATATVASCLPAEFKSPQVSIEDNGIVFDASCNANKKAAILSELANAKAMADIAASSLRGQNDFYYQSFFSSGVRAQANFAGNTQAVFRRASELLSKKVAAYPLKVTCNNNVSKCKNPAYFAFVSNSAKTINFCDVFFDPSRSNVRDPPHTTANRLGECRSTNPQVKNAFTIRQAHRSLSTIILHEIMHTSYASFGTASGRQFIDVAYGWRDSVNLQLGVFNRGQTGYKDTNRSPCKDPKTGKDGICPANLCAVNADSYALTASGLWFSQQCGHKIPDPNRSIVIPTQGPVRNPGDEQPEDPPEL